ncbi:MAG: hypothetical protein LRY73_17150, partial [Bacillus sp. (in: Bacteria)]|nr:hypothetical protein [Bacillus sp. (in: firmicutes)]
SITLFSKESSRRVGLGRSITLFSKEIIAKSGIEAFNPTHDSGAVSFLLYFNGTAFCRLIKD